MPRSPRRQQGAEEACSHVLNRGHHREAVFADDGDRGRFRALLARCRQRYGFRRYQSCLMTNPRRLPPVTAGLPHNNARRRNAPSKPFSVFSYTPTLFSICLELPGCKAA